MLADALNDFAAKQFPRRMHQKKKYTETSAQRALQECTGFSQHEAIASAMLAARGMRVQQIMSLHGRQRILCDTCPEPPGVHTLAMAP